MQGPEAWVQGGGGDIADQGGFPVELGPCAFELWAHLSDEWPQMMWFPVEHGVGSCFCKAQNQKPQGQSFSKASWGF